MKQLIALGGFHTLAEIERAHIEQVVKNCGTLGEAAQALGINAATLYRKRKEWGVQVPIESAGDAGATVELPNGETL